MEGRNTCVSKKRTCSGSVGHNHENSMEISTYFGIVCLSAAITSQEIKVYPYTSYYMDIDISESIMLNFIMDFCLICHHNISPL